MDDSDEVMVEIMMAVEVDGGDRDADDVVGMLMMVVEMLKVVVVEAIDPKLLIKTVSQPHTFPT